MPLLIMHFCFRLSAWLRRGFCKYTKTLRIVTKATYSCKQGRRENGEDNGGHLEGVRGVRGGGPGGERRAGSGREGGAGVVAYGDADDFVQDGRVRRLAPEVVSRRKAYKDAMAWLFDSGRNADAWMLKGCEVNIYKK